MAMGEGTVVLLAVCAWLGAAAARPVPLGAEPLPLLVVFAGLTLAGRRPRLFCIAIVLLASQLGHRADRAFVPVAAGPHHGLVEVVDEADRFGRGWRAPVRLDDGRRVDAVAFGPTGHRLSTLGAGSTVTVEGRLQPIDVTGWARSRHIVGQLLVDDLVGPRPPQGPRAVVEAVRTAIVAGAEPLPRHQQALYTGLVVGEDRLQPPAQRARFRAAGLSHLLAVSGQNVAFVLAVAAVPAAYLPRRARLGLLLGLLAAFAVATRLEPSVLRATVMAGLSTWATLTGREARGLAPLALAVTALVLLDPFLVQSVGFRLSVVASAAIVVIGPAIAARLPGPEAIRRPAAVTLAAQIGVAPLLVHHFDRVPLASIPANLAAGGAAGAVMVWGLTVGPVAGLAPGPVDGWLQLPVSGLLWWLDTVAAWAVRLPLPALGRRGLAGSVAVAVLVWLTSGRLRPVMSPTALAEAGPVRRALAGCIAVAGVLVATVLAASAVAPVVVGSPVPHPPTTTGQLEGGGRWYPGLDGRHVLVVEADADRRLLDSILALRIRRIEVVVAERGSGPAGDVALGVVELTSTGRLLAPRLHRLPGAYRVTESLTLATGLHVLQVEPVADEVRVSELPP